MDFVLMSVPTKKYNKAQHGSADPGDGQAFAPPARQRFAVLSPRTDLFYVLPGKV